MKFIKLINNVESTTDPISIQPKPEINILGKKAYNDSSNTQTKNVFVTTPEKPLLINMLLIFEILFSGGNEHNIFIVKTGIPKLPTKLPICEKTTIIEKTPKVTSSEIKLINLKLKKREIIPINLIAKSKSCFL
ncbi:hypothetical protein [Patiriisocius hiemis]|uniref:Uncharacterized protein n=1 Tax=Patiriisocius hiemis TaxID=3075604 RepID=A0ABU2YEL6_9FLAO|nr:hypothetical protein [Constantimarinum sp. W242]MDT0556639.1 hypothetical protein [Constantimarinum sp. W242]